MAKGLAKLTVASVTAVCVLVALAVMCLPAAVAAGASLALGCGVILALRAPLERAVRAARKQRGNLSGLMAERIIAMRTIQSFGGAASERARVPTSCDAPSPGARARAARCAPAPISRRRSLTSRC